MRRRVPVVRTAANLTLPAGSLIGSAEAGTAEVKLLADDGPEFEPGDIVLLAGDIQQTAQRAGAGRRTSATSSTGWSQACLTPSTLRFSEPLLFGYDAAWPDLPTTLNGQTRLYGAPRVWNCRLGKRHRSRSLTIRNANFGSTALPLNVLHTRLENCASHGECWPALARRVELIDCRLARIEFDKVVQEALLEGCEVAGACPVTVRRSSRSRSATRAPGIASAGSSARSRWTTSRQSAACSSRQGRRADQSRDAGYGHRKGSRMSESAGPTL
jgi:hypothetical protein